MNAHFVIVDGEAPGGGELLEPTAHSRGPWGEDTMHGGAVGALLARGAERHAGETGWLPARLTCDLVKMPRMLPTEVRTQLRRDGRRIRLVDVEVWQEGALIALGRAVFVRETAAPSGRSWTNEVAMPPVPDFTPTTQVPASMWSYAGSDAVPTQGHESWADPTTPARTWFVDGRELVAGEPVSGFVRTALMADAVSPMSNWGEDGLDFINIDYTLALARVPTGEAIGLASVDRVSVAGASTSTGRVFDAGGAVGTVLTAALVNPAQVALPRPVRERDEG